MAKIMFDNNYHFLGRNGTYKAKGLDVSMFGNSDYAHVDLIPITSKGMLASCTIEIPKNKIQELINELQKLL